MGMELSGVVGEHGQVTCAEAAGEDQHAAQADGDGVGDLAGIAHHGTHNTAVELRLHLLFTEVVVQHIELLHAGGFVVEYLDDLGAGNGFLDVAVHRAKSRLLSGVVFAGGLGKRLTALGKDGQECHGDQGKPDVGGEHEDEGAHQRDHTGNQAGEGVVDHDLHVVHVVGEAGHDLAGGVGIEVSDGKLLELCEQIVTDGLGGVMGHGKHQACLEVVAEHTYQEDAGQDEYRR